MKSLPYLISAIAIILVLVAFFYINSGGQDTPPIVNGNGSGEVQLVTLSIKNGNYYPPIVHVKAGQPVKIMIDSSVQGCYKSFTIRQLGLSKNFASTSDSLTFTPTKAGTYGFSCSMGMGTGTLIVE